MDKLAYIARRLLLIIPTFIGITLVCFSLTRVLPGGPVDMALAKMRGVGGGGGGEVVASTQMAGGNVTEEYRKELEKQYGYDKPFFTQYSSKWIPSFSKVFITRLCTGQKVSSGKDDVPKPS